MPGQIILGRNLRYVAAILVVWFLADNWDEVVVPFCPGCVVWIVVKSAFILVCVGSYLISSALILVPILLADAYDHVALWLLFGLLVGVLVYYRARKKKAFEPPSRGWWQIVGLFVAITLCVFRLSFAWAYFYAAHSTQRRAKWSGHGTATFIEVDSIGDFGAHCSIVGVFIALLKDSTTGAPLSSPRSPAVMGLSPAQLGVLEHEFGHENYQGFFLIISNLVLPTLLYSSRISPALKYTQAIFVWFCRVIFFLFCQRLMSGLFEVIADSHATSTDFLSTYINVLNPDPWLMVFATGASHPFPAARYYVVTHPQASFACACVLVALVLATLLYVIGFVRTLRHYCLSLLVVGFSMYVDSLMAKHTSNRMFNDTACWLFVVRLGLQILLMSVWILAFSASAKRIFNNEAAEEIEARKTENGWLRRIAARLRKKLGWDAGSLIPSPTNNTEADTDSTTSFSLLPSCVLAWLKAKTCEDTDCGAFLVGGLRKALGRAFLDEIPELRSWDYGDYGEIFYWLLVIIVCGAVSESVK